MLIGGRGRGKTFSTKRMIFKSFFYKNKKFIWLKTTERMCNKLASLGGHKFIQDIVEAKIFKFDFDCTIDGEGNIFFITYDKNGEKIKRHCGYLMALSQYAQYKGNAYNDVSYVCYDEFIKEDGEVVRGDIALQFVNTIETIGRLRNNYKVVLLSNSLSQGSPILRLFFKKLNSHGVYFNKDKSCVCHYMPNNPIFDKAHSDSISGKILKGTQYENVIVNNEFKNYDELYFEKLPRYSRHICNLHKDSAILSVFINNFIYISSLKNKSKNNYCRKIKDVNNVASIIPNRFLETLRMKFSEGKIRFENEGIRVDFMEFIK